MKRVSTNVQHVEYHLFLLQQRLVATCALHIVQYSYLHYQKALQPSPICLSMFVAQIAFGSFAFSLRWLFGIVALAKTIIFCPMPDDDENDRNDDHNDYYDDDDDDG